MQTPTLESLRESLKKIDELIALSKTDKSIDKKDLLLERRNCCYSIKMLKK